MSAEVEGTKVFDYHNQGFFCTASIRLTPLQLSILVPKREQHCSVNQPVQY